MTDRAAPDWAFKQAWDLLDQNCCECVDDAGVAAVATALRQAEKRGAERMRERAIDVCGHRSMVSRRASDEYEAEGQPDMAATERCASSEAAHIGQSIRSLSTEDES